VTPEENRILLAHAGGCGRCSQVLAELAVNEAEAAGEGLGWEEARIRSFAKELAGPPPKSFWRRLIEIVIPGPGFKLWPAVAAATAMLAIVGGGTAVSWQMGLFQPRPPFTLLARAATESPVSELRFPGAKSGGGVRRNRGEESALAAPESLLEANVRISRGLKKHPNQPEWLRAKAQAEFLSNHLDAARATLEKALDLAPNSPDLQQDLAMVWFESAQRQNEPADYAKAVELFSEVLKARPRDPVARFNRALAFEKIPAPQQALDDWQEFLQVESSGAYADQARQHIAKLQKEIQENGRGAKLEPGDPAVMELLEKGYATLPGDAGSRDKLTGLAIQFQKDYGDHWLSDLLAGAHSPQFGPAVTELCQASGANQAKAPGKAMAHGRTALRLFERAGNPAGQVRAQFEIVLGCHVSLDPCFPESRHLVAAAPTDRFPWLGVQANLELSNVGLIEESDDYVHTAWTVASANHLRSLELRAAAFEAARLSVTGAWSETFRICRDGLTRFWAGSYFPYRGYAFYAALSLAAQSMHDRELAEGLTKESITLLQRAGDRRFEAVERSSLAQFGLLAGEPAEAQKQFEAALRLFDQLPADKANERERALAIIGMARAEVRMGQSAVALRHLAGVGETALGIGEEGFAERYSLALSEAQSASGDARSAEASLDQFLQFGQQMLADFKQAGDRSTWAVDMDEPYRSAVRLELNAKRPGSGLAVWEWYRLARWGVRSVPNLSLAGTAAASPEQSGCGSAAGFVVSYLPFEDGMAVWTCDHGNLSYRWLGVPEHDLTRLARRFAAVCSDPASDRADLQRIGGEIYRLLVEPVIASWREDEPVFLELDGPLLLIPFEAIPMQVGGYLGDRFALTVSPGLLYRVSEETAPGDRHVLAVADPTLMPDLAARYGPLPEAREEATIAASLYPRSTMLTGQMAKSSAIRRELPSATVFHVGGHALATPERNGLLVADGLWGAAEIVDLDLRRCSLVVLAACSTGQLDSDPLFGPKSLVRGFVVAGARQVVASRWTVDSRATLELMKAFYGELQNGRSAVWAMHSAARRVRLGLHLDHPYYWAAYCLFGARDASV
jgi:CHAT domain-containing protein/tetratricopeptide (TPR) repeat protein